MLRSAPRTALGTASNAVRLRIAPAPANIAESREILRVVQRFGEVVTYKHLKHDTFVKAPNSALAIFRSKESVDELLKACPLRFALENVQSYEEDEEDAGLLSEGPGNIEDDYETTSIAHEVDRVNGEELLNRPGTLMDHPPPIPKLNSEPKTPRESGSSILPQRTEFKLIADVWLGHQADYNERTQFWGPFAVDTRDRIQQDLARRVPVFGYSELNEGEEVPVRILRQRQDDMANRETVRDFYNRVIANPTPEPKDPPPDPWNDEPPDEASRFLWRSKKRPRNPLKFAEPPRSIFNDFELMEHGKGEMAWKESTDQYPALGQLDGGSTWNMISDMVSQKSGHKELGKDSFPRIPEEQAELSKHNHASHKSAQMDKANSAKPTPNPVAKQYGTLFKPAKSSSKDTPPAYSISQVSPLGFGEQVLSSMFGEEVREIREGGRYSRRGRKQQRQLRKDDPAEIEALLRRGADDD
ncbi:hypothetical protein EJ08DRAFT_335293 [Tothia fuscella]|uniref:RRM domain-containing protein n=1 Tax=Tothia fuscella TaxID=1048955 RepID=A0A9P4P1U0_9PEZI|nr:hypothetical protein EJ08DRAFT_335293 [Tothia fuscella]